MLDRRLEGGARLVVVPVERGPVAIQLWILGGTAAEGPREHGCAHLLEHMLFKPTSEHPAGEEFDIATAIETLAGDVNAFTSHDETVFHATVPSEAVDEALRAIVGAVVHPRLDPQELRREAKVVVQEIRQSDDDPGGRVGQDLLELLYRGHGYGRPVLGRKKDVHSHDVKRLLGVHRALYAADRAALVVVGPVRPKAVERTAAELLRALPRRARRTKISAPKLPGAARIKVTAADVHEAHLAVGWAAPALHAPSSTATDTEAACALEVASVVLGYGEASRLSERVRRAARLVTDAYASFYASRWSSALLVTAQTTATRVGDAADAVLDEIEALRRIPISPAELQRAQAVVRSEVVYRQETVQGRAHALGYQLSLSGDIDGERRYFEAIDALTPGAVLRACAKYLVPWRTCATAVVPKSRAKHHLRLRKNLASRLRRRRARVGVRKRSRDGVVRVDFPCGFRLRVRIDHTVPMATGWMVWAGGLRAEQPRDLGSSAMMAALLTRGSAATSGDALAQEIDGLAAVLEGFAGRNSVGVHFECLSQDAGVVLRRAFECVAEPRFAEDELDEERRIALEELAGERDDTGGQAFEEAYRLLYRGHPFRLRRRGSETSLKAMTAVRLRRLWAEHYPLSRGTLGLAGDVDVDAVVDLLEFMLPQRPSRLPPAWEGSPPKYPRRAVMRTIGGAREQAHLVRVYPGLSMHDPRVEALEVLTAVLGGQVGRLFQSLREDKGLVYHVSAGASEGLDAGHVSFYAATSHRGRARALAALDAELDRVVAEPISPGELARAKAWLCGQFDVETQRRSRVASAMAFDEAYGMGASPFTTFPKRVRAVTVADVHEVATDLLRLSRSVTVQTRDPASRSSLPG